MTERIEGLLARLRPHLAASAPIRYRFVTPEGEHDVGASPDETEPKPITLRLDPADLVALLEGTSTVRRLFFAGRLQVEGDMGPVVQLDGRLAAARAAS